MDFHELDNELFKKKNVHIRMQQRNGKKCWTYVEGLDQINKDSKFLDNFAKVLKKKLNCAGTVKKPENVIQFQGDHRDKIKSFLIEQKIVEEEFIKMHGS